MIKPVNNPAKVLSHQERREAFHALESLKRFGYITPQDCTEVMEGIEASRLATAIQVYDAVVPELEVPEEVASALTVLPFGKLATHPALMERGINLQGELDSHVQTMVDMGIVPEEQREQYAQKFSTIAVKLHELTRVPSDWRPQLWIDDMTSEEALKAYLENTQITAYPQGWPYLKEFKKFDPKTQQHLSDDQQVPTGEARLTFSPEYMEYHRISADDWLKERKKTGINHMQPRLWLQMFTVGLDRAIKKLNLGNGKPWKDLSQEERRTISKHQDFNSWLPVDETLDMLFPEYRNEHGAVLGLRWHPVDHTLSTSSHIPDIANTHDGVREVLG